MGTEIGAEIRAARTVVGIFLINKNSNEPKGLYQPLLNYLKAVILAGISNNPIANPYYILDLHISLNYSIFKTELPNTKA